VVEVGSRRRLGPAPARWFLFVWVGLFGLVEWGNAAGGEATGTVNAPTIRRALLGHSEDALAEVSELEWEDETVGEELPSPSGGPGQLPRGGFPVPRWLDEVGAFAWAVVGTDGPAQGERRRCARATPARGPPAV